jgi:hypothetical protein
MTEVLTQKSAIDLFRELPTTKYDIVFMTNRILKGITAIEDKLIKRCSTGDYPMESFIIKFQNMGKSNKCNALVYIRGVSKSTGSGYYYSRTGGRSLVGYCGYGAEPGDPHFTEIGQCTLSTMDELDEFTKVIRWTYDFLELYRNEKVVNESAS